MTGYINSIETMGLVDGPGIRFVVFMQGCNLRCLFCHNPETWSKNIGQKITPKELVNQVLKYKNYYGEDGGITFSGGEPLVQSKFLLETLKLCKKNNINTCLDTAGVGGENIEELLNYVDLVMFDIKALTPLKYKYLTGKNIYESIEFLDLCSKMNKKIWIRQVIIPGINDNEDYIKELKTYLSNYKIEKIEFLPYTTIGIPKYEKLKIPYKLKNVSAMNISKCEELLKLYHKI